MNKNKILKELIDVLEKNGLEAHDIDIMEFNYNGDVWINMKTTTTKEEKNEA